MAQLNLHYLLGSGKNSKLKYFTVNCMRMLMPRVLFTSRLNALLSDAEKRPDIQYLRKRVDYYCKLKHPLALPPTAPRLAEQRIPEHQKVYYFDTVEFTRWFPSSSRWGFCPGDVTFVPEYPSIVKSRPIAGDNANSVVMKLDKVRHFTFVNDRKTFADKKPIAIFRGKCGTIDRRVRFMEMYHGHPMVDAGDVSRNPKREEWRVPKKTIPDHLDYRFIISLEGFDVASNLKWVMSSNSLAVMPRPTYETWFMEGTLLPGYHYVEIKPDFSDLIEKLEYYNSHPEEAEEIVRHAHEYVAQFRDNKRENLLSLMVLDKYFTLTGQRAFRKP